VYVYSPSGCSECNNEVASIRLNFEELRHCFVSSVGLGPAMLFLGGGERILYAVLSIQGEAESFTATSNKNLTWSCNLSADVGIQTGHTELDSPPALPLFRSALSVQNASVGTDVTEFEVTQGINDGLLPCALGFFLPAPLAPQNSVFVELPRGFYPRHSRVIFRGVALVVSFL
jgi:hypothetical protein